MEQRSSAPAFRRRRSGLRARAGSAGMSVIAAVAVLYFHRPPPALSPKPFEKIFAAMPSADAYGTSGELRMRFAMPGDEITFPLAVQGDPSRLAYAWVPVIADLSLGAARPLVNGRFVAPDAPGFYRLALEQDGERRLLDGVALAVMVPFERKSGAVLDGYRIGTYLRERSGGTTPEGFVRVDADVASLPLSKHFRVGDFLSHDEQRQWPRFAAVQPRLIDKLELVIAEVARAKGNPDSVDVLVNVNAGFRSPSHNRTVALAARDSRHQYGDAADVAIDANFDGRFSREDSRLVAAAVERVEEAHPELVGGMGLYLSDRYTHSYVHIDARGTRARWKG